MAVVRHGVLICAVVGAVALTGCPKKPDPTPEPVKDAAAAAPVASVTPSLVANADHGKELVLKYECNREV